MALILKDGSVYLHVPKTGGTWVTATLHELGLVRRKVGKQHDCIDRLLIKLARRPAVAKRTFIFCFVRDPFNWYESWWKFQSRPEKYWHNYGQIASGRRGWHPNHMLNGCGSEDFNTFVRNVIKKRPGFVTEMYGWYIKPPLAFWGRQETLRQDLVTVLKQRGFDFDEAKILNSEIKGDSVAPKPIVWDPDLREQVRKLEYGALVRFGYDGA